MSFRNVFAFCMVVAVVVAFIYAARPQWFTGLTAAARSEPPETVTRKTTLVLPIGGKAPTAAEGTDVRSLVDMDDEGLPSRVTPYIMVVNSGSQTIRHYRLTNNVKSVALRTPSPDVRVKTSRVLNSKGPLQVEFWVTADREFTLDVEYTAPKQ
jgi:hypothetical protein